MNTSSRRFSIGLSILAVAVAGGACPSSSPRKTTGDAAAAPDLGMTDWLAQDVVADLADPDLASADVPSPDMFLAGKDTARADLPTGKDTILLADLPAGRDTARGALPSGNGAPGGSPPRPE